MAQTQIRPSKLYLSRGLCYNAILSNVHALRNGVDLRFAYGPLICRGSKTIVMTSAKRKKTRMFFVVARAECHLHFGAILYCGVRVEIVIDWWSNGQDRFCGSC